MRLEVYRSGDYIRVQGRQPELTRRRALGVYSLQVVRAVWGHTNVVCSAGCVEVYFSGVPEPGRGRRAPERAEGKRRGGARRARGGR